METDNKLYCVRSSASCFCSKVPTKYSKMEILLQVNREVSMLYIQGGITGYYLYEGLCTAFLPKQSGLLEELIAGTYSLESCLMVCVIKKEFHCTSNCSTPELSSVELQQ